MGNTIFVCMRVYIYTNIIFWNFVFILFLCQIFIVVKMKEERKKGEGKAWEQNINLDNFVVHDVNKPLVKKFIDRLWACPKQLKRGPETKNKTKIW